MKAGLLEAADLVVVNQADREGADRLEAALQGALELKEGPRPEVLRTVATTGDGVEALRAAIEGRAASSHAADLAAKRLDRARARIRDAVDRSRAAAWWASRGEALEKAAKEAAAGRGTPAAHAARLLGETGR
jgi:LAO/AO transport system kinase